VICCHPHPLFGGAMSNKVVYTLMKALNGFGFPVLRFNFRGVGLSAGKHEHGTGEREDAAAALAFLVRRYPSLPLHACGFSFGAWMALEAGCGEAMVQGILCAGLALALRDGVAETVRACTKPVAVVQGERDQYGALNDVERALERSAGPRRLAVVPGATHLFTEALDALEEQAELALRWLAGDPA
jgi:alpha/beta superfamily hydrolase